jgi:hypothetical protein
VAGLGWVLVQIAQLLLQACLARSERGVVWLVPSDMPVLLLLLLSRPLQALLYL